MVWAPRSLRSGSAFPSFFSRTIDSRATWRASARCAGESTFEYGICAHFTRAGGSNMPNRKRAVNSRFTDVSIRASVMSPCCTACTRLGYTRPQSRSVPVFTASAAAAGAVLTSLWRR